MLANPVAAAALIGGAVIVVAGTGYYLDQENKRHYLDQENQRRHLEKILREEREWMNELLKTGDFIVT